MGATDHRAVRLRTADDAARLFRPAFRDCTLEKFAVAFVGEDDIVLQLVEMTGGSESHFDLPIRSIIGDAILLDARALLIAHCHPSGDPSPSAADIAATRRLARVAGELGIALHDHLIFVENDCRSFRGLGLL